MTIKQLRKLLKNYSPSADVVIAVDNNVSSVLHFEEHDAGVQIVVIRGYVTDK